jgi:YD repeat-containing protein
LQFALLWQSTEVLLYSARIKRKQLLICRCLVLLASCVAVPAPIVAQLSETATTPILGVGHNYVMDLNEIVDPENGALSVRIAAPTPAERGLNLPLYAYLYDSNAQFVLTPNWIFDDYKNDEVLSSVSMDTPQQGAGGAYPYTPGMFASAGGVITGAASGSGVPGTMSTQSHTIVTYVGSGPTGRTQINCQYWDNFIYTDGQGGRHPFPGFVTTASDGEFSCGGLGIYDTADGQTSGDALYTAVFTGNTSVPVFDLHGNHLSPDNFNGVEDTNGNYLNGTGRQYTVSDAFHPMPATLSVPGLGGPYSYAPSFGARGQTSPFPFNVTPAPGYYQDQTCPTSFAGTIGGYSGTATLTLPNHQQYTFAADPTYGLLHQIIYPTGATVTYTWGTNSQSELAIFNLPSNTPSAPCFYLYDWPAVKTRTVTLNGTDTEKQDFSYTTTWGSGQWTQKTTTVTTTDLVTAGHPSYKTVHTYTGGSTAGYTEVVATYDTSGALLETITRTIGSNALGPDCTTLDSSGLTRGTFYQYQPGTTLVTDKAEYDYGAVTADCQRPSTGVPTRETVTVFHAFDPTPFSHGVRVIKDRPESVKIYGNGVLLSETDYTYDEYVTYPIQAVIPAALAHDEANYGTSSTAPRGNPTTIVQKCFLSSGTACTDSVTHIMYDETGQPVQLTDANGNITQYSFADNYSTDNGSPSGNTNTYVTKVTRPTTNDVSHVTTFQYGFNDGKLRTSTDENSQSTKWCYYVGGCSGKTFDPWMRPTETVNPDLGGTTASYDDAGPSPSLTTSIKLRSDVSIVSTTVMDELGRTTQAQLASDPQGSLYVDSTYDGFGRLSSKSNPYRSTTEPTYGITSYRYDALGRTRLECHQDNGSNTPCAAGSSFLEWSYAGNAITSYDERRNVSLRTYDALGNMTSVVEPGGLNTTYAYNALGDLLCVDQWGTAKVSTPCSGASSRGRAFTYDSMSRLTQSYNPETGWVCYGSTPSGAPAGQSNCTPDYDANGNLSSKTDARGVKTSYLYDHLNRLVSRSYLNDAARTFSDCFSYDSNGTSAPANATGRLTAEWRQNGTCSGKMDNVTTGELATATVISAYDSMGRVLKKKTCVLAHCTQSHYQTQSVSHDLAGNVTGFDDGWGLQMFGQQYDAAGRLQRVTSTWTDLTHPGILYQVPTYGPFGVVNAKNGPNINISKGYDNRGRVTCLTTGSAPCQ